MKSYASLRRNFSDTFSEFRHLYHHKAGDVPGAVAFMVEHSRKMEALVEQKLGLRLEGKDLLEIGAGQQMLRLKYMSARSNVTAVDYEVIAQGLDLGAYLKVLKQDPKRFVKTVLRKAVGIDRAYWRELEKYAGPKVREKQRLVQGDAHALPWPDATFDFVYSFSVFEHLSDPAKCLQEAMRVLKPGGGFCISTHIYTSECGAHDPRTFTNERAGLPYWAHLRPEHQGKVKTNAYCNEWHLPQWEKLFREKCPGVIFEDIGPKDEGRFKDELRHLRGQGELKEYSDRELLIVDLWALWKKPDR